MACLPIASRLHHLRIVAKAMKEKDERRKELAAAGNGKGGGGGKDGGFARQEIEVRLMEAQWRMADAEADQDFSLCSRLQRDIKALEVGASLGVFRCRVCLVYRKDIKGAWGGCISWCMRCTLSVVPVSICRCGYKHQGAPFVGVDRNIKGLEVGASICVSVSVKGRACLSNVGVGSVDP